MPITKQAIAIIGSSSVIARPIASELCRQNYRLLLFDENSEEARILTDEITSTEKGADVEFLECTHEACWEADVIFILNNEKNLKDVSEKIGDVSIQKIIVALLVNDSIDELEKIESYFPNSKVVGLFLSKSISKNIHVITRHSNALKTVRNMVSAAGFQPSLKELNRV